MPSIVQLHPEYCVQFWSFNQKQVAESAEVQEEIVNAVRDLEDLICQCEILWARVLLLEKYHIKEYDNGIWILSQRVEKFKKELDTLIKDS